MRTRTFTTKNGRNDIKRYSEICLIEMGEDGLVERCYQMIGVDSDIVVRELFFEIVSVDMLSQFTEQSQKNGLIRFKEVYVEVGKYGVKSVVTALKNDIKFN